EAINVSGVNLSTDVLARAVVDGIAGPLDVPIGVGLVRGYQRDALRDGLVDEAGDFFLRHGVDDLGDDLALARDGSDDRHLAAHATATLALAVSAADSATVPVMGLAADIRLIDFHGAHEGLELVVVHRGADAVAHVPSGAVAAGTDRAVDLKGAHSLLRLAHEVDDLEPRRQGVVGVLKDGADERREAVPLGVLDRRGLADPLPDPALAQLVDLGA